MHRSLPFSRRLLFLCALFLPLILPVKATAQENAHELTSLCAASGALPGDDLSEAGLWALLGEERGGERQSLTYAETCGVLYAYLQEEGLVLPQRTSELPADFDWVNTCRSEVLYCYQGGILGETFTGEKAQENISCASACLLVSRFLSACREPDYQQPVSSMAENPDATVDTLQSTLMMGHSIAHGLFLSVESPMDYAVKDGVSTYDYLDTIVRLSFDEWNTAVFALERKQYEQVYILLGTNDAVAGAAGLSHYEEQLAHIIELVQYYQPDAKVCLISISPIGFDGYIDENLKQDNLRAYNQVQKTLSRRYGTDYLDIFSCLANTEGYNIRALTRDDGIHYTIEGYEVLLRQIYTHPLR